MDEKGYIHIQANRGMYGLPQAGLLANELLVKRLNKRGYLQSKLVPGFWTHDWIPVQFTLVVDDLGVKYVGKEHAKHLNITIEENYTVTTEWDGRRYIGITLDWDYKRRQVHIYMPNYITKPLKKFKHKLPKKNTNHTQVPQSYMEQKSSMPRHYQLHHSLIKRERTSFNKSVENSYSLAEQWTVLCYDQSVQLPLSQRPQRKIQCNIPKSFFITLQHKKRLSSHSM